MNFTENVSYKTFQTEYKPNNTKLRCQRVSEQLHKNLYGRRIYHPKYISPSRQLSFGTSRLEIRGSLYLYIALSVYLAFSLLRPRRLYLSNACWNRYVKDTKALLSKPTRQTSTPIVYFTEVLRLFASRARLKIRHRIHHAAATAADQVSYFTTTEMKVVFALVVLSG